MPFRSPTIQAFSLQHRQHVSIALELTIIELLLMLLILYKYNKWRKGHNGLRNQRCICMRNALATIQCNEWPLYEHCLSTGTNV